MPSFFPVDKMGDAAPLRTALVAANNNIANKDVRNALEAVYSRVRQVPDAPDLAAAAGICPAPSSDALLHGLIGLIVETRRHRNLPFVVRQVVNRCNVPVQLVHGSNNAAFVQLHLADLIATGQVLPTMLATERLNGSTYNGLFLSRAFWEVIRGRGKVFIFQTDSMLCRNSAHKLADFLDFDFIGSRRPRVVGCGLAFHGGNGGFSLRDWKRSTLALDRFEPERWPAGEDAFFPLFMEADGGRVARGEDSDRFCGQRWFEKGCLGLHKPNFRKLRLAIAILSYEPGAWRLLPPIEKRLAKS